MASASAKRAVSIWVGSVLMATCHAIAFERRCSASSMSFWISLEKLKISLPARESPVDWAENIS